MYTYVYIYIYIYMYMYNARNSLQALHPQALNPQTPNREGSQCSVMCIVHMGTLL